MSTPLRDNAHIEAYPEAFQEAYAHAREAFEKLDGVAGVGFGQKKTGGDYREDIAIVVFVREKKAEDDVPPAERIPPTFEGYLTDVRTVRPRSFSDNDAKYGVIQGGIQISARLDVADGKFEKGTLGGIVRRRGDTGRENVYLLSNLHVLYGHGATEKDAIYHPYPPSPDTKKWANPGPYLQLGQTQSDAFIGSVPVTIAGQPQPLQCFVDAAIARIDIDSKCGNSTCTEDVIKYDQTIVDLQLVKEGANFTDKIAGVRDVTNDQSIIGKKVFKVGRTSGRTQGKVTTINATTTAPPDPRVPNGPILDAPNTIEIDFDVTSTGNGKNTKGNARFCEPGDSGSLVVDENGMVIGLFSLGAGPGDPSTFPSNACHIMPVLDKLKICVALRDNSVTTRGCCGATDGSGVALAGPLGDFPPSPDGEIVFASTQVASPSRPVAFAGFPDPIPLSSVEVDHMSQLLAAFRETARGRELHAVFGDLRREVGYLIRNCRPVKVTWHRNQGPAFMALTLNHLRGHLESVPQEIKGISRETLLRQMAEVLATHGSNPLRQAVEKYREEIIGAAPHFNNADECIEFLRAEEIGQ